MKKNVEIHVIDIDKKKIIVTEKIRNGEIIDDVYYFVKDSANIVKSNSSLHGILNSIGRKIISSNFIENTIPLSISFVEYALSHLHAMYSVEYNFASGLPQVYKNDGTLKIYAKMLDKTNSKLGELNKQIMQELDKNIPWNQYIAEQAKRQYEQKPFIIEDFAGKPYLLELFNEDKSHSNWQLINPINGKTLWDEKIDERIYEFALGMQNEIDANSHKGSIFEWKIENDFPKWLYEFEYHKAKLIAALMAKDNKQKKEYSYDLAIYLLGLVSRTSPFKLQNSKTLNETIPLPPL